MNMREIFLKPQNQQVEEFQFNEVQLQAPLEPHSIYALWNNFHERAEKEEQTIPDVPLYFMKPLPKRDWP
ncbi:MAG: hypothetical protein CM1200mP30_19050 [Pseudomonadota bacterium]|nr:MAG: hypothetical protein CM1200mP30_19050 [Pseudomonadota bacterium]